MRSVKAVLLTLGLLLAVPAPASAQSSADGLGHLDPPLREVPRQPSANEQLCTIIDRYLERNPRTTLIVRAPETLEAVDVSHPIHLRLLRARVAQAWLDSERAAGRSVTAAQAQAMAAALRPAQVFARFRALANLGPSYGPYARWHVAYSTQTWCAAARTNRTPELRQGVPGSLQGVFCVYDMSGIGSESSLPTCPSEGTFVPGRRVDPQVVDARTGREVPLAIPVAEADPLHGPLYGTTVGYLAADRARFVGGMVPSAPAPHIDLLAPPSRRSRVGRLPVDDSALPIVRNPPLTTP